MSNDIDRAIASATVFVTTLGVILVLVGLGAIIAPLIAPIAFIKFLAWFFLGAGIIRIVQAFQDIEEQGFLLELSAGILYVLFAILLFIQVIGTALPLYPLLGGTIFLEGVLEVSLAFQLRPQQGWIWVLVSGFLSTVIGVLIGFRAGLGAAWLLGTLVGISIILTGVWFIMLSLGIRQSSRQTD